MPTCNSGRSSERLLIQQADLDHVEIQQVLRVVQDVRLQQLDAVLHRHLEDLFGRQVGQFHARLVDGRQLLLLQLLLGDVADRDDQVQRGLIQFDCTGAAWTS